MRIKQMIGSINDLASVNRYSGSRLCNDESVLEHTGGIALLAYAVGCAFAANGVSIDMGLLLSKAIVHDFDESSTGDIAMPVKYHSEVIRQELRELESDAVLGASIRIFDNTEFHALWLDSKCEAEGSIVALCDLIAVIYKVHDEVVNRGNKTMIHIMTNMREKLEKKVVLVYEAFDDNSVHRPLMSIQMEMNGLINEIDGCKL